MKDYIFLLAPLLGWLIAQTIKVVISLHKREWRIESFVSSGGFPSSHSAFTTALVTVESIIYGIKSIYFAIVAVFCGIVLYDSLGVRKTTGDQTKAIQEIAKRSKVNLKTKITKSEGHSAGEVLGGVAVGIVAGLVLYSFATGYF